MEVDGQEERRRRGGEEEEDLRPRGDTPEIGTHLGIQPRKVLGVRVAWNTISPALDIATVYIPDSD